MKTGEEIKTGGFEVGYKVSGEEKLESFNSLVKAIEFSKDLIRHREGLESVVITDDGKEVGHWDNRGVNPDDNENIENMKKGGKIESVKTYDCRIEGLVDAFPILSEIRPISFQINSPESLDCFVQFTSEKDIDELVKLMGNVRDSHVPIRTLRKISKFEEGGQIEKHEEPFGSNFIYDEVTDSYYERGGEFEPHEEEENKKPDNIVGAFFIYDDGKKLSGLYLLSVDGREGLDDFINSEKKSETGKLCKFGCEDEAVEEYGRVIDDIKKNKNSDELEFGDIGDEAEKGKSMELQKEEILDRAESKKEKYESKGNWELSSRLRTLILENDNGNGDENTRNEIAEILDEMARRQEIEVDEALNHTKELNDNSEKSMKKGGKIGFEKLASKIEREYEKEGRSKKVAKEIGIKTAAKIKREKGMKRGGKIKRKSKHIGFDTLAKRIEREYEKKGITRKNAKKFGKETAAKVYREKLNK